MKKIVGICLMLYIIFVCCYFFNISICYISEKNKYSLCHNKIDITTSTLFMKSKSFLDAYIWDRYKGPKVSFCTTYKDRFEQISKTLPINLANNRMDDSKVEFILIDFDPTDTRLKEFIFENFSKDIASGYLKYYQTDKMPLWDFSVAKNTSHYYATNDIVVNLDADNYTGYRGGKFVSDVLANNHKSFLWQKRDLVNGAYGRISFYRKDFDYLGGYDEKLPEPAGYQDDDLMNRAKTYLNRIHRNFLNDAIKNDKDETIKHTKKGKPWLDMQKANKKHSEENIKNGKIRANNGIYGIREGVIRVMFLDSKVK